MIYHDTQRPNWNWKFTATAFFGTTLAMLGASLGASTWFLAPTLLLPLLADLAAVLPAFRASADTPWTPSLHRARLMWHPLRKVTTARLACGILAAATAFISPFLALPLLLAGELLSRYLYFRGVHSPKMTGSF